MQPLGQIYGARLLHRRDFALAKEQVGPAQAVEDVVPVAVQGGDVARHHVVEVAQPVEGAVHEGEEGAGRAAQM